jgi:hypothetical protein
MEPNSNRENPFKILQTLPIGINKKATNVACRGELGKFPLLINIHKRIIKYIYYTYQHNNSRFCHCETRFLLSKNLYLNNQQSFYLNVMKILKSYDP